MSKGSEKFKRTCAKKLKRRMDRIKREFKQGYYDNSGAYNEIYGTKVNGQK